MQNLRLNLHPFSLVFALSALTLILGATAAWYVRHLYDGLSEVLDLNVSSVRSAEELEIALREIQTQLNDVIYRGSAINIQSIAPLRAETDRWLKEASRLATTPPEQELIRRINLGYQHFIHELDHLLAAPIDREARDKIHSIMNHILSNEIIAPAHAYLDINEETMVSVVETHKVFSQRFSLLLLAISICGCSGGFFIGLQAARRLRRTMVELNLPLMLAAGKLSEVVGPIRLSTTLDLFELKNLLELIAGEVGQVVTRLQTSREEVLQSEKLAAIGQLAAGTAHEIRNPLMSIKLLVQSALSSPATAPLAEDDLLLIEQEICRLERTVQNLLDFARPPRISRSSFEVSHLFKQCLALVAGRAAIQNVRLRTSYQASNIIIDGDFQQLQQVLLNMLINALDAMPHGGDILIESSDAKPPGSFTVTLIDEGEGIPEPLLPRMFEPFASSKASGTGLGLSISKQIVEAHHGHIFAKNREQGGSLVGFSLPYHAVNSSTGSPADARSHSARN